MDPYGDFHITLPVDVVAELHSGPPVRGPGGGLALRVLRTADTVLGRP
ncbi:hypothetical protein [Streptomyces sp. Ag109_G2-15]|nr:hypothetical protein [Streptomyces sp. Ag109_G2-15]